jgi:tripartite-type tricarboxylate transporter receptor subunit TctC
LIVTTVRVRILGGVVGLACLSGAAFGQAYPTKPVRIVTAEPGGANDIAARLIAPGLSASLGQQFLIDNRPAGVIPGGIVSKAPPDGHTLLVTTSLLWILPLIQSAPFDTARDFAPVMLIAITPGILVTHPSLPVKNVRELIALAKARPGELDYASGATGSSTHLAAELFKSMAGVNIVRVPFRGAGPAVLGLLSGQVQLMFASTTSSQPHILSHRLRPLAVTSATRSALSPELPTLAESGLSGYEWVTSVIVFAPAGTPAAVVNRLNSEIAQVLKQAEVRARFLAAGLEVVASSPAEVTAVMKKDVVRASSLIKSAGIKAQ